MSLGSLTCPDHTLVFFHQLDIAVTPRHTRTQGTKSFRRLCSVPYLHCNLFTRKVDFLMVLDWWVSRVPCVKLMACGHVFPPSRYQRCNWGGLQRFGNKTPAMIMPFYAFSGCNMAFVLQARSLQLVGSVLNTSNWMSYVPARQVSQPAFCMHVWFEA